MPLHTWYHEGHRKPSSYATGKKKSLASMHTRSLQSCPTPCDPVDYGLPGFSVREGNSPGKNPGAYWLILVVIPF